MIRFAVLGSGSSGNAAIVEAGGQRLMIDAGLSARQLTQRLAQIQLRPEQIDGILLTHEHGDHVRGLKTFVGKHATPVFSSHLTAQCLRPELPQVRWKCFERGNAYTLGALTVHTFATAHDAVEPLGYVFAAAGRRLGLLSDAGHVTPGMIQSLSGCHGLFLEANYDAHLLEADHRRPWAIKERIRNAHGHLSNEQTADLVARVAHPELRCIILGHLSSDCNRPERAMAAIRQHAAQGLPAEVHLGCALPDQPSAWFEI